MRNYRSAGNDIAYSIIQTPDNGYVLAVTVLWQFNRSIYYKLDVRNNSVEQNSGGTGRRGAHSYYD